MKTISIALILMLSASLAFGQDSEEEAIKNAIATEVQGFLDGVEGLADSWSQVPRWIRPGAGCLA